MLDQDTIKIIKSTVPTLEENGEALTRHFYKRMFTGDPHVAPYFNAANQHAGKQQKALAAAILGYAANIDNLGALGGAVDMITHKHASLGIQAEHYDIVGKHLLASICELLGLAEDDPIITAWGKAYGALAEILIGVEQGLYDKHTQEFGHSGFAPYKITRKLAESETITSFYLEPADGSKTAPFKAGQYLTVRVPTESGSTTMRNYSLSVCPAEGFFRISVKSEKAIEDGAPDGYVSNYLHTKVCEGDIIEVAPPCGIFTLKDDHIDKPLVLISGGVGITPVLSMLKAASARMPGRKIQFIHGALNSNTHAFRGEVTAIAEKNPNVSTHFRYSNPLEGDETKCDSTGFLDAAALSDLVNSKEAEFYFCGPEALMASVLETLSGWGVPEDRINYEFFGPAQALAA